MQQNFDLIDLLGALNAEGAEYLLVGASYIAKPELIANKRAAARPQDLADLAYLESREDG